MNYNFCGLFHIKKNLNCLKKNICENHFLSRVLQIKEIQSVSKF